MTLTRGDEVISLEPKAFDVLVFLVEHRDRLVTKDELLDAVWKDTFVTPNVLTRAIALIRKAVGDDAQDSRLIETASKRGYRFIADVEVVGNLPASPEPVGSAPTPDLPPRPTPTASASPSSRFRAFAVVAAIVAVVAIAGAFWWKRPGASLRAPQHELSRITTRGGYESQPTISPDGRSIAFVSDRTGPLEIYVTAFSGDGPDTALTSDGGQNVTPAWSPDGRWIAFHSARRGGIWIVASGGGVPQQVVDFGSAPSWSPDSETIAFTSDAGGMSLQSTLWIVHRDGTARREITVLGRPKGGHRDPSWSHDGKQLVFVSSSGGFYDRVYTLQLDSGAVAEIADRAYLARPQFAPDDLSIIFGGTTPANALGLIRVGVDRGGKLASAPELLSSSNGNFVDGLWVAKDGTVVFSLSTNDQNLWSVDLTATGGSQPVPLTHDATRNSRPTYLPDGRVAFIHTTGHDPLTVGRLMNDDGTGQEAILPDSGMGDMQSTARGLFVQMTGKAGWLDLATRRVSPVSLAVPAGGIGVVSPDGTRVAFHRAGTDGVVNVWVQTIGTDAPVQVTFDREAATYPVWSPDGRTLAIEIKRGDRTEVALVPSEGGAVRTILDDPEQNWPNSFSPDGHRIVFSAKRGGVWNVMTVPVTGGAPTPVTQFTSASGFVRYPVWSPSGRRIVFERAQRTASIWALKEK